jgi:carboxypeptidase T
MELILRVRSTNPRAMLAQLPRLRLGLDFWEVKRDYLVVRASEAQADRLRTMGYDVEQLYETERFLSTFGAAASGAGYHNFQSLEDDLRRLADSAPEIAELREIGRSVEGRPIWALRIGERKNSARKVLFLGCHHAREWLAVEVPYLLAEHLVSHANQDPIKQWLTQGEVWVAPMVNPDGHEYSRDQYRLWRKNRRKNPDGSVGVDPNRNYGYMWGTANNDTTSHVPADNTYIGPKAFSEPETQAVRDLIAREHFGGLLTYHSFSQLILYPWGYTNDPIVDPGDHEEIVTVATRMQELIRGVHGAVYEAQQAWHIYSQPVAGDTCDWAYGTYHIPAFTIELRPRTTEEGGFILPPDQIQPVWEENQPAAFELIRQVLLPVDAGAAPQRRVASATDG